MTEKYVMNLPESCGETYDREVIEQIQRCSNKVIKWELYPSCTVIQDNPQNLKIDWHLKITTPKSNLMLMNCRTEISSRIGVINLDSQDIKVIITESFIASIQKLKECLKDHKFSNISLPVILENDLYLQSIKAIEKGLNCLKNNK